MPLHYRSRNYVTRIVHNYQERAGDIETMLNEVDTKIRMVGRIEKNDIEKLLKCVSEKGRTLFSFKTILKSQTMLNFRFTYSNSSIIIIKMLW